MRHILTLLLLAIAANAAPWNPANVDGFNFRPTRLSDCQAWHSSFIGFAGFTNGQLVETWFDASANGRHFTNPATAKQPYYTNLAQSGAALAFDGIDDALHSYFPGFTNNCSVFMVVSVVTNQAGNNSRFFTGKSPHRPSDYDNTNSIVWLCEPGSGVGFSSYANSAARASLTAATGVTYVVEMSMSNGVHYVSTNLVYSSPSTLAVTSTNLQVSLMAVWAGTDNTKTIAKEVIYYNRYVGEQRTNIIRWLGAIHKVTIP